jgi:hypothetical protein
MKTVKLLATLAILAGGAANAVTVDFTTGATSATNQIPPGGSVPSPVADTPYRTLTFNSGGYTITASAFYYNAGTTNRWLETATRFYTTGTPEGVSNEAGLGVTQLDTDGTVTGAQNEYLLLDFGAGATATVSSLVMWLDSVQGSTTAQYFTYSWLGSGSEPTNNSATPTVPLTAYGTANPAYVLPSPGAFTTAGIYTFDMSSTGSGRFLLLGSTNHSSISANRLRTEFLVQNMTFTAQVPDGAATLALLGGAFGVMGLASRRRRE